MNDVVFPFVIIVVSELRDVAPPGLVEGAFGGSHREIVEMVLSFGGVYPPVATVTSCRDLEALLEIVNEILEKIVRLLDSSDNRAHTLLKS